jgi:hypothetical protein
MTVLRRYGQRYGQNPSPTAQAANWRRTPCNQTAVADIQRQQALERLRA